MFYVSCFMEFILGKKIGMSQIFDKDGNVVPVTVIEAGPCFITQIKTKEKDGYSAVQIGFGDKKKLTKPLQGHLKRIVSPSFARTSISAGKSADKQELTMNFRWLKEFKIENGKDFKEGDKVMVDNFKEGDSVKISGIAKSKGFQGVVKRHHFRGFPASHGTKHGLRTSGSIGSSFPQRVFKGLRMAGRMGGGRITVKNLEVAKVDVENNLLAVKGAVPGKKGTFLEIRKN